MSVTVLFPSPVKTPPLPFASGGSSAFVPSRSGGVLKVLVSFG